MDFYNSSIIGVSLPDQPHQPEEERYLHADFVVIVKDSQGVSPLLYQLKEEEKAYVQSPVFHLSQEAFMMLGGVIAVDRKRKEITFSNTNHEPPIRCVIAYNHLVVVSDAKQALSYNQVDQFCVALQAIRQAEETRKLSPIQQIQKALPKKPKQLLKKFLKAAPTEKDAQIMHHIQGYWNNVQWESAEVVQPKECVFEVQM